MKIWTFFLASLSLLAVTAAAPIAHAQESRQDASVSYSGIFSPTVVGNGVFQSATVADAGILASYRYLLTPRGAVEGNYQFNRDIDRFQGAAGVNFRAHTQLQEFSAEYVYSAFSYHNIFPFIEGGVGGYFFGIINDSKTSVHNTFKSTTAIGVPFGGGIAYELSPSFDIRLAYRAIVLKAPSFSPPGNVTNTGRYELLNDPVVGVAYHF